MRCFLLFNFVVLAFAQKPQSETYMWGLARTACEFFTPSHLGRNRRPPDNYYQLSSEKVMFSPGETIEIKVMGSNPSDSYVYTGLLMSVRKNGESFGTWEESYDFQHVDCDNKLGSAFAGTNKFPKVVGANVFRWTAPEECDINEMYYVSATVVKTKREFMDGLLLPLKCVQPSSDQQEDSCTRQFNTIPEGATTSFEPTNPGRWTSKSNAELRWQIINGSTPSPGTGPKQAFDGNYYMYMESSFPARKAHRAILIGPPGLAGCLCFRFAYHMYTDLETKFFCTVNDKPIECQHPSLHGDIENVAPTDVSRNMWIKSWVSINEPGSVEIKIIGQRGATFRGDIGLDSFMFSPGRCQEDDNSSNDF